MLKMLTTQLTGLFKRIEEKEAFSFEDGARLLAQAPVGDGAIYLFGAKEMKAIVHEAIEGAEPFKFAKAFTNIEEVNDADRVVIFTRYASDSDAVELAMQLQEKEIPFVGVSTVQNDEDRLVELADVHIDLALKKGLLPDEFGNRFCLPSSMAGMFVYYGMKFTIEEILEEYDL